MTDFLQVADVLMLHSAQIALYGGEHGVRDLGLLESAVAQAETTFGGQHLHGDLFEMAAAYLFHVVQNHPFVDGNKRTGAVVALVSLDLHGADIDAPAGSVYEHTRAIAPGQAGKPEVAEVFRKHAH